MAFLVAHCITFPVYTCGDFQSHSLDGSSNFHRARSCKTMIWTLQAIETSQISKPLLHVQLYGIYYHKGALFTTFHLHILHKTSYWIIGGLQPTLNASSNGHSTHMEMTCPDLPLSHDGGATNHWQLLHCPELNLPLTIRISIWFETLRVGYNQCFRANFLHSP